MKIEVKTITPEFAKSVLEHSNFNNRKLKTDRVTQYARDMKRGKWTINGECVCFDENGNLINGQHRLLACIKSGCSFETIVAYGLDPECVNTIDIGTPRSTTDAIRMRYGIRLNTSVTGAANAYLKNFPVNRDISRIELEDFIYENANVLSEVGKCATKGADHGIAKKSGFISVLFAAYKCGVPLSELERFSYVVNTGFASSEKESAAIVLRNFLLDSKNSVKSNAGGYTWQNLIILVTDKALTDFLCRKTRKKSYKISKDDSPYFFNLSKKKSTVED